MAKNKVSKMHQRVLNANKGKVALTDNNFWDDCNNHFEISTQAIHDVEGALATDLDIIVNTPELASKITDVEGLANNLTILRRDLNDHVDRLKSIRENHKDKSGGITTPEEGVEVIQINGKYQEAMAVYDANIMPVVCHIYEQIAPAQQLLQEIMSKDKASSDLTDPSVISDAVVKGE